MIRRRQSLLTCALLLPLCLPVVACDQAADIREAQSRLTDVIPDNATPGYVLHYLDQQKIEHSDYERNGKPANTIHATIRQRVAFHLFQRVLSADYHFDAQDHLVEKTVAVRYSAL